MSRLNRLEAFIPIRYADLLSESGEPIKLLGCGLVDYTLRFLETISVIDRLIICADDPRVEKFFKSSSLVIEYVYRDDSYSFTNSSWEVFEHWVQSKKTEGSDFLLFCEVTHPIRSKQFFGQLVQQFERLKSTLLVPCVYERHTFWRRDYRGAQFVRLQGDGDSSHDEALVREVLGLGTLVSKSELVTNSDIFSCADLIIINDSWASIESSSIHELTNFIT